MSPKTADSQTITKSSHRDDLRDDAARPEDDARERRRDFPATLACGEQWCAPEHAEQDERDDEDDRRTPVEEPRRHGEILDPPDAVRDEAGRDQGLTSTTASSASVGCSSTSNRPAMFAVKGIRTAWPGTTSFSML